MGISPFADGTWTLMDRTPPGLVGRFLEQMAVCWASLAHVWQVAGAPGGANVWLIG
jgi:hypothetical protein